MFPALSVGAVAWAVALAGSVVPVSANLFKFSTNLGTDSPDLFALNGRGSQVIAMTNFRENDAHEVTIHVTTIGEGGVELSVPLAEFTPINDFGFLDLVGDHVTGQMLFVTEIDQMDSVVNIYHADWYGADWSLLQTLAPAANTSSEVVNPANYFGSKFAVDHKTNRVIAVGYGDGNMFSTTEVGYGKICMFEATSPAADQWLPTQVLTMPDSFFASTATEIPIRLGGNYVNIHDDVLIADTFIISKIGGVAPEYGLEIFHRGRNGLWSHQQSFVDASVTAHITLSVVYEQTIVYAINNLHNDSDVVGRSAVYIMHPNTPDFQSSSTSRRLSKDSKPQLKDDHKDSKPKPKDDHKDTKPKPKPTPDPLEWAVVQTLWSPNHDHNNFRSGSDVGFGQDMGFYGNILTVSEVGVKGVNTGFLYVFERTSKIGMFTMQQVIVPSIPTNNYLSLHRLNNDMLMASSILATNNPSNDIWLGNNTAWSCLNIKLEDAFGDGWDGARLSVATPFKDIDYYAPMCHTNPLVFRYCPSEFTQEGKYHFKIEGAKAAKFAWEIKWLVYEESSGETFRGDQATEMDFIFEHGRFKSGKRTLELPTNQTCQACGGYPIPPPKPQPKPPAPKAKPSARRLHASDDDRTAAPSISPAPTLAVSADENWASMVMASAGGDWFRDEYTGTHFYISDTTGQKLISTGTMCGNILSGSCLQSLTDGEYILRVTGDLNMFSDDHTWSFCGRSGTASDSLTFSISNGVCVPLLRVTTTDTCLVLNPVSGVSGVAGYTVALGSFLMTGMTGDMTGADKQSFEEAVSHTIPGAVSGGVHVVSVTDTSNSGSYGDSGVVVEFSVQLKTQDLGYDLLDATSIEAMISMEKTQLEASSLSQKMVAELLGGTISGGRHSVFSSISSVKLVSFQMGDLEFAKSPLVVPAVTKVEESSDLDFVLADLEAAKKQQEMEQKAFFVELGVGGYVLAGVAMMGLVVLGILKKRNAVAHKTPSIASDFNKTPSIASDFKLASAEEGDCVEGKVKEESASI